MNEIHLHEELLRDLKKHNLIHTHDGEHHILIIKGKTKGELTNNFLEYINHLTQ